MSNVTVRDVKAQCERARRAAIACGFADARRWELQTGSPTNGRAWRLFAIVPGSGAQERPLPGYDGLGYLGWTRREAYCALAAMAQALEAVTMRDRALVDARADREGS